MKKEKDTKSYTREDGIQAIIDLLALVGDSEPREQTEQNWDAFTEFEKDNTMAAHEMLCS